MTRKPRIVYRECVECGDAIKGKGSAVYCTECIRIEVQCKGCGFVEKVRRSSSRIKRGGEYCNKECKTVHLREDYSHDPIMHELYKEFYSHVKQDYRKVNFGQWEAGSTLKLHDYALRKCMKCEDMFTSESKGHRHCSNCTYTSFGHERSHKRNQIPMNQYGVKQHGRRNGSAVQASISASHSR